jgi:hypothetical protein
MATGTEHTRPWYRRGWALVAGVAVIVVVVVVVVVAVTTNGGTPQRNATDSVTSTTSSGPATTTTISPFLTTTSTTAAPPPITLKALNAAVVARSGLGAGASANCGPAPTGLGVGSYVACGLDDPSTGISEEILQMTGTSPSSFNVVAGPGTSLSCQAFNNGELAAWTAQDQGCAGSSG